MSENLWDQYAADDGFGDFQLSNRDKALFLIGELDLDAQLLAIQSLVDRNRQADKALNANIQDLAAAIHDTRGSYGQYLEGQWIDNLHGSVFQDAAHSMAAVGMLVPFIEALFVSIFSGLNKHGLEHGYPSSPTKDASLDHFWDPHYMKINGKMRKGGLVDGIMRLSNSTGLQARLPRDLETVLTALFSYRNKMFHNGFEWPEKERQNFNNRIKEEGWSDWFSCSTHDHKPWVFYMRASFIDHCLTTIDQVLEGLGKYLEEQAMSAR